MPFGRAGVLGGVLVLLCSCAPVVPPVAPPGEVVGGPTADYYRKWVNGPNPAGDPSIFPINVWMQDPSEVVDGKLVGAAYREIGVPATLGLWDDPAWSRRRDALFATGWSAYVSHGKVDSVLADPGHARSFLGYLLVDEPDMQKSSGGRLHPEFQPSAVLRVAQETRAKDPSRPTVVNFGAWMGTPKGRERYGFVEQSYEDDMRTYCSAADIASADYYGWSDADSGVVGAFRYGEVVDTMRRWCGADKPVFGFVETGHPYEDGELISPDQVESAVWNCVLHGANGINYFAHSFYPEGRGDFASAVSRADVASRLKALNARLQALAPVLNAPAVGGVQGKGVAEGKGAVPVAVLHKVVEGWHYVFVQADGDEARPGSARTRVELSLPLGARGDVEVLDEGRSVAVVDGVLVDDFEPYQVHVYRFATS
ncbi:hypothetical protein ABZ816_40450 [Actinosynnema sp. NPDC047251]|uniref:Glycoside hydrolase family 42 N-terminal domain-containing protein n=1 Tax=Saccharothrix espanaensis (strain ATCC 51144 / DSM 44229 / JCM 9112 / NBRC 15066 / NRRL 15764) TaxID=1179773 RepID=K0JQT2_SACES|nr:hypothetical protein [Saccharothrix espanaensis]CCH29850.1 hypothetical protein BN6_25360 [Saccharothrix espanaensis DSM 44229]